MHTFSFMQTPVALTHMHHGTCIHTYFLHADTCACTLAHINITHTCFIRGLIVITHSECLVLSCWDIIIRAKYLPGRTGSKSSWEGVLWLSPLFRSEDVVSELGPLSPEPCLWGLCHWMLQAPAHHHSDATVHQVHSNSNTDQERGSMATVSREKSSYLLPLYPASHLAHQTLKRRISLHVSCTTLSQRHWISPTYGLGPSSFLLIVWRHNRH